MLADIDKSSLHHALQHIAAGLPSKTVMPILSGVKLQAGERGLQLTSCNLAMTLQYNIPASAASLIIQQAGCTVVPARYFMDIVRSLPDGMITLDERARGTMYIRTGNSMFRLSTMNAAEFPDHSFNEDASTASASVRIANESLKSLARQVAFAASTSEARPILTGVSLHADGKRLRMLATDGVRLASGSTDIDADYPQTLEAMRSAVIPAKHLTDYSKMLTDSSAATHISVDGHTIRFGTNGFSMRSSLIEGHFPPADRLIPTDFCTEIKLDTAAFADAVKRVSLLSGEASVIGLQIANNEARLFAKAADVGDVTEAVAIAGMIGEPIKLFFNGKYMKEIVNAIDSEQLYMRFAGKEKPIVLETMNLTGTYYILTPIRSAY